MNELCSSSRDNESSNLLCIVEREKISQCVGIVS